MDTESLPELEAKVEIIKKRYMGKTVRFVFPHPRAGETGTVVSLDETNVGLGFRVEIPGSDGAYFFNQIDVQIIN